MRTMRLVFGLAMLAACAISVWGQGKPVDVRDCADRYDLTLVVLEKSAEQLPHGELKKVVEHLIDPTQNALASLRLQSDRAAEKLCGDGALADLDEIVERLHGLGYPLSEKEQVDRRLNDIRNAQVRGLEALRCNVGPTPATCVLRVWPAPQILDLPQILIR